MKVEYTQTHSRGRQLLVPSVQLADRTVMRTGRWIRLARVKEEELVEGQIVPDPASFVADLKASGLDADVLTFPEKPPAAAPRLSYPWEWDNWAAIPTSCFNSWWEGLPQEARKNVRRAAKRGVEVRSVPFSSELARGIKAIYDETPVRQGRTFWHYGKSFETVYEENESYVDRSEFIGAYHENVLIGFIKQTYVDRTATIMQILPMNAHADKRPMNAMLAHAVEVCQRRGVELLIYGQYVYGKNQNSSLTEFKRRNGFQEIKFPRYYVPLTMRGRLAVASGAHLGIRNLLPGPVDEFLVKLRAGLWRGLQRKAAPAAEES